MQYLMQRRGGERRVRQRQMVHVAVTDLTVARLALVEIGAGHRQHVVAQVDAEPEADLPRQNLQDAAGARADVQEAGRPFGGEQLAQRRLDHPAVDRKVALAVPGEGAPVEILLGLAPARFSHRLQPPLVQLHAGVVIGQQSAQGTREAGAAAGLGTPVEHPAAFAKAVEHARLGQDLEMPGDTRLTLPQDLAQLAHGPLPLRADGQQAQARRVRGGTDAVEEVVERTSSLHHRASPCCSVDM